MKVLFFILWETGLSESTHTDSTESATVSRLLRGTWNLNFSFELILLCINVLMRLREDANC